jgi:uncharacterized membrane-anchored protein
VRVFRRGAPEEGESVISGPARVDRRTKNLIPRLQPGDIAIIDHDDLDRVAAEGLRDARVAAVVNAAPSITGRYPNLGALVLVSAGIPLVDHVGSKFLDEVPEGTLTSVIGGEVFVEGMLTGKGIRQDRDLVEKALEAARGAIGDQLEEFAQNTLSYIRREQHVLTASPMLPDVRVPIEGQHVLIVVRGLDYREDLEALRRIGYIAELKPVLIGVDGGADALLEQGLHPDIILGDFDSVSADALRSDAELIVHAYPGGGAPGAERLDRLNFEYQEFEASGTSEDVAMQLAWEHRAELIVAVGSHSSMNEFLDKGREGMASTFLTRLKVGAILVDAKGVSRLYRSQVRKRDLMLLVLSALFTLVVIAIISEPIRLLLRSVWEDLP